MRTSVFGSGFRQSSSVVRCCGFDRAVSSLLSPFSRADDCARRDGFHLPKWKGSTAGQVRHDRRVLSILLGAPRLFKITGFVS